MRRALYAFDDRRKDRIGDVGDEHPQGERPAHAQAPGERGRSVTETCGCVDDPFARFGQQAELGPSVEHPGHGGGMDIRGLRDVGDSHAPARQAAPPVEIDCFRLYARDSFSDYPRAARKVAPTPSSVTETGPLRPRCARSNGGPKAPPPAPGRPD